MEKRQIFDIKKYESIQYLGNVIKDTMPFMLNAAVTYKFDNNIDDINEQIQRFLYYRSECSLVLDQRFLIRSNNGITLSPTYGLTNKSYNIAFMFHENMLSSCRWLIVLYGHQIYIGFNMFTHDAFRGNTEVMVNLLEELNMNRSDITCSYGMPTGYECRGYSGFYQIKGINNLPLKYTFMERLIRYFDKYYKDEDELIEKRKSGEMKKRNVHNEEFGYFKLWNCLLHSPEYGCIADFRSACDLLDLYLIQKDIELREAKKREEERRREEEHKLEEERIRKEKAINEEASQKEEALIETIDDQFVKNLVDELYNISGESDAIERSIRWPDAKTPETRKKKVLNSIRDCKTLLESEKYIIQNMIQHLARSKFYRYGGSFAITTLNKLIESSFKYVKDDVVRYIIYALEYNYISRQPVSIEVREAFSFKEMIRFTKYHECSKDSDIIWKYVFAKLNEMPHFLELALVDPEFIKLINGENRKYKYKYDISKYKFSHYVESVISQFEDLQVKRNDELLKRTLPIEKENVPKTKVKNIYLDAFRDGRIEYPEDKETAWKIKNVFVEDFTNIEDDPEWKFYNMSMKDLLSGNF